VPAGATIADGIAVRRVGALTYELAARLVDNVVTVDEAELANAVLLLLEIEKTVVEGAGAAPLAALLNRSLGLTGGRVALVLQHVLLCTKTRQSPGPTDRVTPGLIRGPSAVAPPLPNPPVLGVRPALLRASVPPRGEGLFAVD